MLLALRALVEYGSAQLRVDRAGCCRQRVSGAIGHLQFPEAQWTPAITHLGDASKCFCQ